MEFKSKLDDFVRLIVEEKLEELSGGDIDKELTIFEMSQEDTEAKLKGNHVVIAECRTRKEYNLAEDDRYSAWLRESVVSHIKVIDTGDVYTVSYDYTATSKCDNIENIKVEQLGNENEIIEIVMGQYRDFDEESIEIDVNNVRMKVIKKSFEKYTKESSVALNF